MNKFQSVLNAISSGRAVNLAMVVACAVIVMVALLGRSPLESPNDHRGPWMPGQASPIRLLSVDSAATKHLVVVLSSRCKFCTQEMPFYRALQERESRSKTFTLQFVGVENAKTLSAYLRDHELDPGKSMIVPSIPGLTGTPSLLLLDANQKVLRSWQGVLTGSQKDELLKLL